MEARRDNREINRDDTDASIKIWLGARAVGFICALFMGMMLNGRRVIYGDLLRGRMAKEKPGIYLRDPPSVSTGGGCDQIQLWYDVDAHHMLQIQCYGLG